MDAGTDHLVRWLTEFCAMGNHRVATEVDRQTIDWFADTLSGLGATSVERRPFVIDRCVATSCVVIDGKKIPSDTLYYEGTGEVQTDSPHVAAMAAMGPSAATTPELHDEIARARARGARVAVVATTHPQGLLQMPNRPPQYGSGLPVVLVPGRFADTLAHGQVHVEFNGAMEPGQSANVVATFGDTTKRPILLTTPLSGWFTCAAERGTGIAVLFDVISRIAAERPVLVVGTSAHELFVNNTPPPDPAHLYGVRAYLTGLDIEPAMIVHFGANVALAARNAAGSLVLAPGLNEPSAAPTAGRGLFARFTGDSLDPVQSSFMSIDMNPIRNPPQFPGEGELWAAATAAPMISFVGITPYFHTPEDTPDNTTSPQALVAVSDAIVNALRQFR